MFVKLIKIIKMLNFFKSSPPKITEKMLIETKIKILLREDLIINKSSEIALTGSGKFYKGTYKNWPVSIKVVDITTDDLIINEFIYWQAYNGNDLVLSIFGVCLSESKAYIVLEAFNVTMETALEKKMVNNNTKIYLGEQVLKIISKFQHNNKRILDLRPGVFGITDKGHLKLLDFGFLVNPDKLINHDKLIHKRLLYMPPEYIEGEVEDMAYDIWSFGCMLLDIFSDLQNVNTEIKKKKDEIKQDIINGDYPYISSKISPIAGSVIMKCLNKKYDEIIKIEELEKEYKLFIDSADMENISLASIEIKDENKVGSLSSYYDFIQENEKEIVAENHLINTELLEKSEIYLKGINAIHSEAETELQLRLQFIEKTIKDDFKLKNDILEKIKNTLIDKLSEIKKLLIQAVGDIMTIQEIFIEMKQLIDFLNKTNFVKNDTNPIFNSMNNSITHIKFLISKYSDIKYFDKIIVLFNEAKGLIDIFKDTCTHRDTLMDEIIDVISTHKKKFIENTGIQNYLAQLNINPKSFNDIDIARGQRMKYHNYYVKPIEGTNIIQLFDIFNKQFTQITMPNCSFPTNSFFYFDRDTHICYQSGGLINKVSTNEFYEIKITFDILNQNNPPKVQIRNLPLMLQPHSSHSSIKISDNFLFVIGGDNTTFCEVFNITYEKWSAIPELPYICPGAALCYYMKFLYLFGIKKETNDGIILRLRLKKSLFPDEEHSLKNNLKWESDWELISYTFTNDRLTLEKGMGAFIDDEKDRLYLFGGCDIEGNIRKNILEIILGEKVEKDKNKTIMEFENLDMEDYIGTDCSKKSNIIPSKNLKIDTLDENLPITTHFNSNLISFDNCYLMVIDAIQNCYEYDIMTKDCYVYLMEENNN